MEISKDRFLRLNPSMALRILFDCAQYLDRNWPNEPIWARFTELLNWSLEHRENSLVYFLLVLICGRKRK